MRCFGFFRNTISMKGTGLNGPDGFSSESAERLNKEGGLGK